MALLQLTLISSLVNNSTKLYLKVWARASNIPLIFKEIHMANLELKHINKIYPNNVQAVFDFNLTIQDKEFIVFVGPSGCGKSTTLRMIAGLEEITSGELYIDGHLSNNDLPKDRDIAMVFQSYALYPHMTVYNNMAFSLKMRKFPFEEERVDKKTGEKKMVTVYRKLSKEEIDKRVRNAAEILELTKYLDRKPKALSGGQRQRVALGRAIVRDAKVFLMDEPLSNLDAKLRVQMRSEIIKLHERLNATMIYVTHDQTEAMTMATRIVVMKDGYVQQIGTPREIYYHPANKFVASFIGSPAMNFFTCSYQDNLLHLGDYTLPIKVSTLKEKLQAFYNQQLADFKKELTVIEEEFTARKNMLSKIQVLKEKYSSSTLDEQPKLEKEIAKLEKELALIEEKNVRFSYLKETIKKIEEIDYSSALPIILGIRPNDIAISKAKDAIPVTIDVIELLGSEVLIHSNIGEESFTMRIEGDIHKNAHDTISIRFNEKGIRFFDTILEKAIEL